MKKIGKKIGIVVVTVCILFIGGFLLYVNDYEKATQPAIEAMVTSNDVYIEESDKFIAYIPGEKIESGFIFYPGGKVEPRAYARLFHELAKEGIQTVVVKMPFNLAMFGIHEAEAVWGEYTKIERWYMGGHSLGGVFGTEYLKKNIEKFEGMIYMASYPNTDIANTNIKVLSINGTLDTVLNRKAYEKAMDRLPKNTIYYTIEGGNHSQFGDYGLQTKDTKATISPEQQHKQIVEQIVKFIGEK